MRIGVEAAGEEWFEVHFRDESCEVALNPSAKEFRELYDKLTAPYARYRRKHDGSLPSGVDEEVSRRCVAETVLRDWRGIEGPDGEPVTFSIENAQAVMADERVGEAFMRGVMDAARSLWESFAVELEQSEGN